MIYALFFNLQKFSCNSVDINFNKKSDTGKRSRTASSHRRATAASKPEVDEGIKHTGNDNFLERVSVQIQVIIQEEKQTLWPSVRKRTIPTDDRHLSPKFSANFCG
jgi:hypothetical protein